MNKKFLEHDALVTTLHTWDDASLGILQKGEPIDAIRILDVISGAIQRARLRIYATHNLESADDLTLPGKYLEVLQESKSTQKYRSVFGRLDLFEELKEQERGGFISSYTTGPYQRMILVDDTVFYRIGGQFYISTDTRVLELFLGYFDAIRANDDRAHLNNSG